jgi:hypothetical protein
MEDIKSAFEESLKQSAPPRAQPENTEPRRSLDAGRQPEPDTTREENIKRIIAETDAMYVLDRNGVNPLHNQVKSQIEEGLREDVTDERFAKNMYMNRMLQPIGVEQLDKVPDKDAGSEERQSWYFAQRIKKAREAAMNETIDRKQREDKRKDEQQLQQIQKLATNVLRLRMNASSNSNDESEFNLL